MADNKQIAKDVVEAVGGKDNVVSVVHCMTRLRFTLKDMGVPNPNEIKRIDGVLGAQESGGQFQVIVGQNVPKVYDEVCNLTGLAKKAGINENLDVDLPKEQLSPKHLGSIVLKYLSGSMVPLIPMLICAGLLKVVPSLFGPRLLGLITETSDIYVLVTFLSNAGFYFLPIYIGYTASRQIGLTPILGAFMGGILLEPTFMQFATNGTPFTVAGIPCTPLNYSSTVLPILLAVPAMYLLERIFKRIVPDILSTICVPLLTLLVSVPLTLCLLAPLGSWCGNALMIIFEFFGSSGGIISAVSLGILCGLWQPMVLTGMHVAVSALGAANFMAAQSDSFFLVAIGIASFSLFGVELGAWLRLRNKKEKAQAFGFFVSNVIGGVSEPFMYGMMFRYSRLFICNAAASCIAGAVSGLLHVTQYTLPGVTNFLAVLRWTGGPMENTVIGFGVTILVIVLGCVFTYLFGFTKDELENGPVSERD